MNDLPDLAMSVNWYPWEIEVFRRADGHCEYCNKDMMASSDAFYHDRHFDHIRPDEGDGIENMAVACKACNSIKRDHWFAGYSRVEIIANAKTHIRSMRERNDRRLVIDKAWFLAKLANSPPGRPPREARSGPSCDPISVIRPVTDP